MRPLIRDLVRAGAEVQVVMTPSAAEFVTPLTLATLSRREVLIEMFPAEQPTHWTRHIELGLWADVMMIAPATANTIAKIAHGLADNFLTTLVLALRAPLALAPSMDVDMYLHRDHPGEHAPCCDGGMPTSSNRRKANLPAACVVPGRLPEVAALVQRGPPPGLGAGSVGNSASW